MNISQTQLTNTGTITLPTILNDSHCTLIRNDTTHTRTIQHNRTSQHRTGEMGYEAIQPYYCLVLYQLCLSDVCVISICMYACL